MKRLKEITALIKIRVTLLSTLSAVTGFIVAGGGFSPVSAMFAAALFVTASGSAALNQYQERKPDALMERTMQRPLPSGRLAPGVGLTVSLFLIFSGLLLLFAVFGTIPALLGFLTVVSYNGIYTYLKRVTAFAVIPGALVGALPPAIGWTAAGGAIASPTLAALVFFFYIWQIPHFWLLLEIHSRDYSRAGFPSLKDIFTSAQLSRITFTWVAATACAGLLFPLFGMFQHPASLVVLAGTTFWLGIRSLPLVTAAAPVFRRVFMNINIFALLIMVILIIDHGVLL
ncbi:MAG: protoheme IX farnesyltransferase [bacterium]|nr:protoheme IX farnesyltransferase [bacterium]